MPIMVAKAWADSRAMVMVAISMAMARAALLKAMANSSTVVVPAVVVLAVPVLVLVLAILRGTEGRVSKDKPDLCQQDKLDSPVNLVNINQDRGRLASRMVVWVNLDGTPVFPAVLLSNLA